jgi:hypothetical protein
LHSIFQTQFVFQFYKTMKTISTISLLFGLASAMPLDVPVKREVPQEHSHNQFLAYIGPAEIADRRTVDTFLFKNNPNDIVDSVFGLLGDGAAAGGAGKVTNLDCLQQVTADSNPLFAAEANSKLRSPTPRPRITSLE